MSDRCSIEMFEKIAEVRRDHKPEARYKLLFEKMIKLATQSAETGWCKRAGRELAHAKKVAGYR